MKFNFEKVILPMIRRIKPNLIASEIVGVQPMSHEHYDALYNLKVVDGPQWNPGDIIHSFIEGYGIIDNDLEFVPWHEFQQRPLDFEI